MNRYGLEPGGRLAGRLGVPGDKSISHRVLLLAAWPTECRLSGA